MKKQNILKEIVIVGDDYVITDVTYMKVTSTLVPENRDLPNTGLLKGGVRYRDGITEISLTVGNNGEKYTSSIFPYSQLLHNNLARCEDNIFDIITGDKMEKLHTWLVNEYNKNSRIIFTAHSILNECVGIMVNTLDDHEKILKGEDE